jgi:effector-binding domain-containing protein
LGRVDAYLAQLEGEQAARYDVVLRQIEPVLVASVCSWVTPDEELDTTFEELEQYVAQFKARAALPPALIYHDSEYRADGQKIEIVVPLTSAIPERGEVQVYELPGWEAMACLIHRGGYDHQLQTFAVLLQWIELNNYAIAGPTRGVFLRFGADQQGYALPAAYVTTEVEEWVTELQVPVLKR